MMRRALAVLGAAGVAVALAGCGGQPAADVAAGKTKYTTACAACHALEDAGAPGGQPVGGVPVPSLDDAFRGARHDGWKDSQIRGVVARWIRKPAPPMPTFPAFTDQDVEDVAAYVASVAGKNEESAVTKRTPLPPIVEPGGLAPGEGEKAEGAAGPAPSGAISVDADPTGALAFTTKELTAAAGDVTLELRNESPIPHNIAVRGNGVDSRPSDTIRDGSATAPLTVALEAGEYEFYCAVPGHLEAGMKGTLTVK